MASLAYSIVLVWYFCMFIFSIIQNHENSCLYTVFLVLMTEDNSLSPVRQSWTKDCRQIYKIK